VQEDDRSTTEQSAPLFDFGRVKVLEGAIVADGKIRTLDETSEVYKISYILMPWPIAVVLVPALFIGPLLLNQTGFLFLAIWTITLIIAAVLLAHQLSKLKRFRRERFAVEVHADDEEFEVLVTPDGELAEQVYTAIDRMIRNRGESP